GTFSIYGERPVAILVLRNRQARQRAHIDRLAGLFGLTLAEARLAIEMARGDGREAAAARCGISVNTARSHLTRIFEKTGVSRQAELAKLLSDSGIT
ncbi:MAG: helix-turn-helix transcriptional regulator, partial [Rhodobiaceae bacterium]|nr:helix-turn-helix transcriptional regulator [Rhodobiaceae bacterium]